MGLVFKLPKIILVNSIYKHEYRGIYAGITERVIKMNFSGRRVDGACTYGGCFCWQNYEGVFLGGAGMFIDLIKAPTIIVVKQKNVLKTMEILFHELGHWVVWLVLFRGHRTRLYNWLTKYYDMIWRGTLAWVVRFIRGRK